MIASRVDGKTPTHTRVLVVDDSATQRSWLVALLEGDPDVQVAGCAKDGAEAVRLAARLKPDVITMDLRMPVMDGLEASRRIMRETPTPIVLVTGSIAGNDQSLVAEALRAGVLSVELKPAIGSVAAHELLAMVKGMARVKVVRRTGRLLPAPFAPQPAGARLPRDLEVIAIGASTGGPQALHEILTQLPAACPLPVVVVQHITPGFAQCLVDWLTPLCPLPMSLAQAGQQLTRGIYLAPSGEHLIVRDRALHLSHDPPVSGHRPSVTMLFQSIAREYGAAAVGVLLTGMGDDGAVGLRDLKLAGSVTIAQDEASSIVFGMPAVAIALGVVDHELPPARIAALLCSLAVRTSAIHSP